MKTNCFFTMNFHYSSKPRKHIKTNCFFHNFAFTKIHLENPYHFFDLRISIFERHPRFLLYVCSDFNHFLTETFALMYPARSTCIINVPNFIFGPRTKHTVKPHWR